MKVTVRRRETGELSVYIPKKDLEAEVVFCERPDLWGGRIEIRGGIWLTMPELPVDTKFPVTVEARKADPV
ncbi:MAG: putative nitrogen fixation protein NifT [Leptonema illini]|jgi:probable nitrogen fixation protein FixT|uniref:Putative nitrogen fixation protein NifT n=1 Tax=Leptonema illini TaxID=183 RepID=A0A833M045_9LEPT|nr:MAG: putative nitrogen fixation protein NifT [Leptonema illini]